MLEFKMKKEKKLIFKYIELSLSSNIIQKYYYHFIFHFKIYY